MRKFHVKRILGTALVAAWGISLVVVLLQTLHKASRPQGSDLMAYLGAARALLAGQDPYVITGRFYYMYPLPLAVLTIPLTFLPWKVAVTLWFLASVAALMWGAGVLAEVAAEHLHLEVGPRLDRWALGATLWFLLFDPIQNDLVNGQINFPVLLMCLLFLRALLRGRDVKAAVFLSAAVSIKMTPALFLAFAAIRRRWGVVAVTVAATIALWLSPLPLVGRDLLRDYGTLFGYVLPFAAQGLFPAPHGVAFSMNRVVSPLLGGWASPVWGRALAAGLPLTALALLEMAGNRGRSPGRDAWIFTAYLLVILLATPFSEVHHLAYLAPAAGLIGLFAVSRGGRARRVTAGGLVVFGTLLWGGRLDRSGPFFFLAIILLLGLVSAVVLGWREPVLPPGERRENRSVDHAARSRPDAIGAPPEEGR